MTFRLCPWLAEGIFAAKKAFCMLKVTLLLVVLQPENKPPAAAVGGGQKSHTGTRTSC